MTSRFACPRWAISVAVLALAARAQTPPPLPTNPSATPPGATSPANPAAPPTTASAAAAAPAPVPQPEEDMVQIKLPDADLDTILSALEIYSGKSILRPAALPTATYNLKLTKPIPRSAAIRYIETVLALNGIGVVPLDENVSKVVALTMARTEAPEIISGSAFDLPPSGRVATKLFQLEFMRVAELLPMLQGFLNPNYGGPVQLPNANAALITDSVSNLQRVESLLQHVDKPVSAGMKPRFYQLRNGAKASDLVNKLRSILSGTLQLQLGSATTYNADDRTNQIILVTDPRQYPFFDELIAKLDVRADPNTRNEVIYLNHAKAVDVVNVLTRIISGQTQAIQRQNAQSVRPGQGLAQPTQPTPPGTPPSQGPQIVSGSSGNALEGLLGSTNEFSTIMTVVNDDRSNSVVVSGTVDDIRLLRELVEKLDRVLAQVRIEVVIAEVTLDDNHQSGISALGLQLDGDKLVGFAATGPGLSVSNAVITRPGITGGYDLAAEIAIATTPRKSNNTILSVPAITTSHGKESMISSGEKRPVITGTISSAVGATTGLAQSSTVTQQQIGTTLTVTPYIGEDGSVQLDLKQTVEDVTGEVLIDNNVQYIIGSRETTSYVTAKSGEIIVLGGFQKKIDLRSTSRLGPIPIIGDLLGTRRRQNYRQELIFFLRPTVLTNNPAIDNAPAMNQVERFPTRDQIKEQLDPNFEPPPKRLLDQILPR